MEYFHSARAGFACVADESISSSMLQPHMHVHDGTIAPDTQRHLTNTSTSSAGSNNLPTWAASRNDPYQIPDTKCFNGGDQVFLCGDGHTPDRNDFIAKNDLSCCWMFSRP